MNIQDFQLKITDKKSVKTFVEIKKVMITSKGLFIYSVDFVGLSSANGWRLNDSLVEDFLKGKKVTLLYKSRPLDVKMIKFFTETRNHTPQNYRVVFTFQEKTNKEQP